jgi:hypothetical protein
LNGDGVPDLVVANSGSNDVSVLLGQGTGSKWTLIPGPRIKTDPGPSAVALGDILGTGHLDLAVANRQANNVEVFPGLGGGFFNDVAPVTYTVGQAPVGLFLGNFGGAGSSIATLNGGSSTISLISPGGSIQTIGAGGVLPVSGFAGDFLDNGFTDLVVGNNGDGRFALFTGGPGGLTLAQTIIDAAVPSPTSLSFAGVSGGVLSFYAATEGRETATLLAFDLLGEDGFGGSVNGEALAIATGPSTTAGVAPALSAAAAVASEQVASLLGRSGSPLDLVATLFTVSAMPGEFAIEPSAGGGVALIANFTPAAGPGPVGQSLGAHAAADATDDAPDESPAVVASNEARTNDQLPALPIWGRMAIGLEAAWEQIRAESLKRERARPGADPIAESPQAEPARDSHASPDVSQIAPTEGRSQRLGWPRPQGHGAIARESVAGSVAENTKSAVRNLLSERAAAARSRRKPSTGGEQIVAAVAVISAAVAGAYLRAVRQDRKQRGTPGFSRHR